MTPHTISRTRLNSAATGKENAYSQALSGQITSLRNKRGQSVDSEIPGSRISRLTIIHHTGKTGIKEADVEGGITLRYTFRTTSPTATFMPLPFGTIIQRYSGYGDTVTSTSAAREYTFA
jgi:hypothetical protein